MAKYYAILSGLPNLGVEDRKLPFSSATFLKELDEILTNRDKQLLDLLRFEKDNKFVINFLLNFSKMTDPNHSMLINIEELGCVLESMKNGQKLPKNNLPLYIIDFLYDTQAEKLDDDREFSLDSFYDEEDFRISYPIHIEDRLAEYYYKYATNCGNEFVEEWAQFNLNIKNVFVAHIARELNWNPVDYIVGDGEIERKLKESSTATNFSFDDNDIAYFSQILTIINEKDITRRERMLDLLRWTWLEDQVFDRPFDIESILCYYLQLSIVERWTELNEKTGEETFRKIVANLKKESNTSLEQFKRNQKNNLYTHD